MRDIISLNHMGEKFISVNTRYGRKGEPMAPPHKVEGKHVRLDETIMGEAGGEILPIKEYYARATDVKPVVRTGEQLTKSDKDELAILRQQMADTQAEEEAVARLAGRAESAAREFREALPKTTVERDLEEQAEDARREAEMAYGDAEVAQRAREAEERLVDYRSKQRGSGDANKTMIVKPLEFKKPGFLARLFGRKQK